MCARIIKIKGIYLNPIAHWYKMSITQWVASLPKSNIQCLYFFKQIIQKSDGHAEYILQLIATAYLSKWTFQENHYYICPGMTPQCCHVYKNNTIERMMRASGGGDHLTFEIARSRLHTQYVTYDLNPDNPILFTRDQDFCDFIDDQSDTQFSQIKCLKGTAPTIGNVYASEPLMINVIQELFRKLYTSAPLSPDATTLQHDNAPLIIYKGLTLTSKETIAFFTQRLFSKILDTREDLESVEVFLDESLVIMYDFSENARMVFHMNMNKVLRAAYANAHPQTASEDEQRALEELCR